VARYEKLRGPAGRAPAAPRPLNGRNSGAEAWDSAINRLMFSSAARRRVEPAKRQLMRPHALARLPEIDVRFRTAFP